MSLMHLVNISILAQNIVCEFQKILNFIFPPFIFFYFILLSTCIIEIRVMQGAIIGGIMAFLVLILTAVGIILYIRYKKRYIRNLVYNILPFTVLQKLE